MQSNCSLYNHNLQSDNLLDNFISIIMQKAWHIINDEKCKYFLVDVLPHSLGAVKIPIEYQRQKYTVNADQLLPYDPQRSDKLFSLEVSNSAQVLAWLKKALQKGEWIKVHKFLCLDFGSKGKQRGQFIKFIFGRFLISQKRKQYLCVSNDQTMENKERLVSSNIFKVIASISNLWPYKIPLQEISKLHFVLFHDLPTKIKIYVEDEKIVKMSISSYRNLPNQLLGDRQSNQNFRLNSRLFSIIRQSSRQARRYYRVPYESPQSSSQKQSLETLTEYFLHLGLNINQITTIFQTCSIIMNINCMQFIKTKKGQGKNWTIKQNSIIRDNLKILLGQDLNKLLEQQILDNDSNMWNKQTVMMGIIYEQLMARLVKAINQKLLSTTCKFQNFKQFIYLQMPPIPEHLKTSRMYFIDVINRGIEANALKIPYNNDTFSFDTSKFVKHINAKYEYDINKEILEKMNSAIETQKKMKNSQFIQQLKYRKLSKICSEYSEARVKKLQGLWQQIQQISKNKDDFINYIIQSTIGDRQIPMRRQIIQNLQKGIQYNKKTAKNPLAFLSSQADQQETQNEQTQIEEQPSPEEQQMIEMKLDRFQKRFYYCDLLKSIHRSGLATSLERQLHLNLAKENNGLAKQGKVYLKVDLYLELERQREIHEAKIDKIKSQFKKTKFRHSIFRNLKILYGRIRLYRFLCNKYYPLMKIPMKHLKQMKLSEKFEPVLSKIVFENLLPPYNQIKYRSGIQLLRNVLNKDMIFAQYFMTNLKRLDKDKKKKKAINKIGDYYNYLLQKKKEETFRKLSPYQIIVSPPQNNSGNTMNVPVANNNPQPIQNHPKNQPINNKLPQQHPIPPDQTKSQPNKVQQKTNSLPPRQIERELKSFPDQQQPSQEYNSYKSNANSNDYKSFRTEKQPKRQITEKQFINLKDEPKFSFEQWCKQAVGFQRRKPIQQPLHTAIDILFKRAGNQTIVKEPEQQLNVDILTKERVVVNPFFPFLKQVINGETDQKIQKIMSHQDKMLKQSLITCFPKQKYSRVPTETFNNILKIGKDKNSSKSRTQLINMILKPIRDSFQSQKGNVLRVFEGQPAVVSDYSWDHNIIKDQMFLQFIKQIMVNEKQQSLVGLGQALEVITRYYYPSPKFLYPFLHFLKSIQSKNIEPLNKCFVNTLLLAQAYQRFKGNDVTVLKQEIFLKEKQSHACLQPRQTLIFDKQIQERLTIQVRLLNQVVFQFKVRNETLSFFKRKVLKAIKMFDYADYFGLYYCPQARGTHFMMNDWKKAIDFLNQYPQEKEKHILYLKMKVYFPFNIKQINKTRLFYLNSVYQQKHLPWPPSTYETVVALSMVFQQFQDHRINNYLIISNQKQDQVNLKPIQDKYAQMVNQKGKKVHQMEYFKQIKQKGFLAAKTYMIKNTGARQYLDNINRVLIKPLQLCFYESHHLVSSISLKRIKGFGLQKDEIHLEVDYSDEQGGRGIKTIHLKGLEKISEFYHDLSSYISYLS